MKNLGIEFRGCYIPQKIGEVFVENPTGLSGSSLLEKIGDKYGTLDSQEKEMLVSILDNYLDSRIIYQKRDTFTFDSEFVKKFKER